MTIQKFKPNDSVEQLTIDAFSEVADTIEADLDQFYSEAYESFKLGDILFDLKRDYIASVIAKGIYRRAFYKIQELSDKIGTFETYIEIFYALWGTGVDIEFLTPSPGVLNINISNIEVEAVQWVAQAVVGSGFAFDNMVETSTPTNNLIFQSTVGINVQEGMNEFIKLISVAGITTTCTLIF